MKSEFKYDEKFIQWVIELRRHFHQFPEVSFNEFETQKRIMKELDSLGIENSKIAKTGVIAIIRGAEKGKTIALRADMDAVNIKEERTGFNDQYISKNDEAMHACGHDGHMAMVLGAGRKLQEARTELKGSVKLIFQPAEEVPPGGALEVIKMGGLDDVEAILGAHLFTNISSGEICTKKGALMASHCKYDVVIKGLSGHHFKPEACVDPILIASEFVATIKNELERVLPPEARYVFGFGIIKGGTQFNQTPDNAHVSGSYRTLDKQHLQIIEDTMKQNLDRLMKTHVNKHLMAEPTYHLEVTRGYPVLNNDWKFTQRSADLLKAVFPQIKEDIDPVFASEDFARYLERVPGTFIFLGAGNKAKGIIHGNHSGKFDIDESVLIKGVEMYYRIARDFLNAPDEYLD